MKKTILKFLIIISFLSSYKVMAYNIPASLVDVEQLSMLAESGSLSSDQYDEAMDIIESGGDSLNTVDLPLDEKAVADYEAQQELKLQNIKNGNVQDIAASLGVDEVQNYSVKQTIGHGDWAFEFLFIDKAGNKKIISSYNANTPIRPGSTMKLFTSWAAYKRGLYPIGNIDQRHTMTHMLKRSSNIEADEALRAIARANPSYVVPVGSWLNSIIGHKMNNTIEKTTQIIDSLIIKGCSIIQKDYSDLEDHSKFHQVNGSGLQDVTKDSEIHLNKVTPRLELALLNRILRSGSYDRYKVMLPQPGNGTLTSNFETLRNYAKIHAKTGTLGNAKALAGFVEIPQGTIIFSVISDRIRGFGGTPKEILKKAMTGPIENIVYKNVMYVLDNAK
jgi:hypothetical protein